MKGSHVVKIDFTHEAQEFSAVNGTPSKSNYFLLKEQSFIYHNYPSIYLKITNKERCWDLFLHARLLKQGNT